MLAQLLAGILGLMAFTVCMLGGLTVEARAQTVILRGLEAMIVFCLLGWVVGWAAEAVIVDRVRKEAHEAAANPPVQQNPSVPAASDEPPAH